MRDGATVRKEDVEDEADVLRTTLKFWRDAAPGLFDYLSSINSRKRAAALLRLAHVGYLLETAVESRSVGGFLPPPLPYRSEDTVVGSQETATPPAQTKGATLVVPDGFGDALRESMSGGLFGS